jgi:hypothetical protein
MVKPTSADFKPAPPGLTGDALREKRLADALRANLRRRKVAERSPAACDRKEED